ncbi:thiamine-phosphate kinase [uncultured Paludibaculum sp.]|uniref:thiamine-phosphate kinase n=1 Tax=uncultured Paludibaculum sp. TaxID=1765020 RepID=UPI002AAC1541|nr:thiamine-phosphate kinase [uncultured Paludibaculum sp.]
MNELSLITAIRRWSAPKAAAPGLVAGIGDDCAIIRPRPSEDLLFTTDFLIEDVHFTRAEYTGIDTGWKALARGLSDIAAMGGDARYALVSLALAPWCCHNYVRDLYKGLNQLAGRHGVNIIGGDVTKTEKLSIDTIVIGAVPRGKALRRSGAKPGDVIYVSGALGRAAVKNYRDRPAPRLELGRKLRGKATACMDLSDGLAMDLHRLAMESGVAAELDGPLPSAPNATLEQALFGGEDYELLCTLPAGRRAPLELTRVGRIVEGKPGRVTLAGESLHPRGWDPLA